MATIITTTCSDCSLPTKVNIDRGTVEVKVPSNGKRGSLHVPAHVLTTEAWTTDDYLFTYDCPACGYADSVTEDQEA